MEATEKAALKAMEDYLVGMQTVEPAASRTEEAWAKRRNGRLNSVIAKMRRVGLTAIGYAYALHIETTPRV